MGSRVRSQGFRDLRLRRSGASGFRVYGAEVFIDLFKGFGCFWSEVGFCIITLVIIRKPHIELVII